MESPEATTVGFEPIKEEWSEYMLTDGNTIRIKLIVTKVRKTNLKNPDGMPVYNVISSNVVQAFSPEEIQKTRGKFKTEA